MLAAAAELEARRPTSAVTARVVAPMEGGVIFLVGMFLYTIESALLSRSSNWIEWALGPLWALGIVAFLAWTPVLLLHHRITWRDALPGALLGSAGLFGLRILSSLLFTNWLNWYSKYYGGLGIVMALFFWLALAMTILIVGAALSPAYAIRRQAAHSVSSDARVEVPRAAQKDGE